MTDCGGWDGGVCGYEQEQGATVYPVVLATFCVAGDGERYVGPKILAYHLGKAEQFRLFRARSATSAHGACVALPRTPRALRFTPDGTAVLYTSDVTAYSNMYLVEAVEFDELPNIEQGHCTCQVEGNR